MSQNTDLMHQTSKVLLLNKFSYVTKEKGKKDKMTLAEVKRVDTFNDLISGLSDDYAKKNTFS